MRKLTRLTLLFALMGAVMLSACSANKNGNATNSSSAPTSSAPANEDPSAAPSKPVTIKWWIYPMIIGVDGSGTGNPDDFAKEYARKFKEIHPHVDVEVELLDWAGGTEKIDISVASGSAPDLVYTINNFGAITKFGEMGALEPIDDFLTEEDLADYSEAVQGAMKYKGQAYMWPWLKLVSGFAVNLDIFEERGAMDLLPMDRPLRDWTYDEFLKAAQATTYSKSGKDKPDVYGTGIWGKDGPFYMYLYGVGNGGNVVNDAFDTVTIADSKFATGMQFMVDLVNEHKVASPGAAGLSSRDVIDMFLNQQIAMVPAGADMSTTVADSPTPFKVGYVAPPHGAGESTAAWNNVGGFMVFKQEDEEKKKMVMEFAKFITNAENSKIVKATGSFPARNSSGDLYEGNADMTYFGELSKYGNSIFSRSFGMLTVAEWEKELQAMLTGENTVESSLANLNQLLGSKFK